MAGKPHAYMLTNRTMLTYRSADVAQSRANAVVLILAAIRGEFVGPIGASHVAEGIFKDLLRYQPSWHENRLLP